MIRLAYLPANERWAFVFGDSLLRLYATPQEPCLMFFRTREDAINDADACGLGVDADGTVYVVRRDE